MIQRTRRYAFVRTIAAALLAGIALSLVFGWTLVRADDSLLEWRGTIQSMPNAENPNIWIIGGKTFVAIDQTEFDVEEGPLVQDGCAKVEYAVSGETLIAYEIDSEPDGDCDGSQSGGDDTQPEDGQSSGDDQSGGDSPSDDGFLVWRGIVEAMPSVDSPDTWKVGGRNFKQTAQTELDQEEGALQSGVCAKVEYEEVDGELIAREIDSEPIGDCDGSQNGGDDTQPEDGQSSGDDQSGDDSPSDDGFLVWRGIVEAMPSADNSDTWTVGGRLFKQTAQTELDQEEGALQNGSCAKVEYEEVDGELVAREIDSEPMSDCDGSQSGGDDDNRKDDDNDGDDDPADDDDERDDDATKEGHVYGIIEELPQDIQSGNWKVSGVTYEVTSLTELDADDGPFKTGARVRVEYLVLPSGKHVADEIETTDDSGDVADSNHSKLVGFVQEKPLGFQGTWNIGGAAFEIRETSILKEDHGVFEQGSYVEVEYSIQDNVRVVHEMETRVRPGGGEHNDLGIITEIDDSQVSASSVSSVKQIKIDDRTYAVVVATQFDDDTSTLTVGNHAVVNSYMTSDGRFIATRVQGIRLDTSIFLPVTLR